MIYEYHISYIIHTHTHSDVHMIYEYHMSYIILWRIYTYILTYIYIYSGAFECLPGGRGRRSRRKGWKGRQEQEEIGSKPEVWRKCRYIYRMYTHVIHVLSVERAVLEAKSPYRTARTRRNRQRKLRGKNMYVCVCMRIHTHVHSVERAVSEVRKVDSKWREEEIWQGKKGQTATRTEKSTQFEETKLDQWREERRPLVCERGQKSVAALRVAGNKQRERERQDFTAISRCFWVFKIYFYKFLDR